MAGAPLPDDRYKLTVVYGRVSPNETGGLDARQAQGAVEAFLRDMLGLPGSAITKITLEVEVDELEAAVLGGALVVRSQDLEETLGHLKEE